MNLAADRRARIPFALIGVLLLVVSVGYAATAGDRHDATERAGAAQALDEATAAGRVTLRQTIHRAALETAKNPPVIVSNTSYGQLLAGNHSIRRALRLRIAVGFRQAVSRMRAEAGGVQGHLSLSAIADPADARQALQAVSLTMVPDSSAGLRVTIENVTVTASRTGTQLAEESYSPTVTVSSPFLKVHDRVKAFQAALREDPLSTGVARRLTARLFAVAMGRGWAQYSGASIQNVLANRHVEVALNGALIATQAAIFDSVDRPGRNRYRCAVARTGLNTLLSASGTSSSGWTARLLDESCPAIENATRTVSSMASSDPNQTTTLGFDRVADAAYIDLIGSNQSTGSLEAVIDSAIQLQVRPIIAQRSLSISTEQADRPSGWIETRTERKQTSQVASGHPTAVSVPDGWGLADRFGRIITTETRIIRHWRKDGAHQTTVDIRRERTLVSVGVLTRATESSTAPGPISASGRSVLATQLGPTATAALLGDRSKNAIAKAALSGTLDRSPRSLSLRATEAVMEAARTTVERIMQRLRAERVRISRSELLAQSPADRLQESFDARRQSLRGQESPYDSLRARVMGAAERAYLDSIDATLAAEARTQGGVLDRVTSTLGLEDIGPAIMKAGSPLLNIIGNLTSQSEDMRVQSSPSYLVRTALDRSGTKSNDSYFPLAVQSRQPLSVPWSAIAKDILGALIPSSRTVRFGQAAQVLDAAVMVPHQSADVDAVSSLRERLREALETIKMGLVSVVASNWPVDRPTASTHVSRVFQPYATVHDQALAAANGSVVASIVSGLDETTSPDTDPIAVRLRSALREFRTAIEIPEALVSPVIQTTKSIARKALSQAIEAGVKRASQKAAAAWARRSLVTVPAGIPVTPVPGSWYTTVNGWTVSLRGVYDQFTVSAPVGNPVAGPDARLAYTRQNATVTLDVDDDGTAELLGRNTRLSMSIDTGVFVAVPPGGSGVGDVHGLRNETSPGWNGTATDLYMPS